MAEFGKENKVAITDPVYPVYLDTNIMSGRDVIYLPVTAKNNFMPELPKEKVDMIYLCFPNNPTGTVLTKEELNKWVDYAKANNSGSGKFAPIISLTTVSKLNTPKIPAIKKNEDKTIRPITNV